MLDVDHDTGRSVIPALEDPVQQKLEALEGLVTATDQTLRLSGPYLKNPVTVPLLLLDLHDETKVSEDCSE
jgi:hypothetical protein